MSTSTPPTRMLSARELYLYDTQGFLHIPRVLAPGEVEEARAILSDTEPDHWQDFSHAERWDQIAQANKWFGDLGGDRRLVDRAHDVINQPMRLIDSYALSYQPGGALFMHSGNVQDTEYEDGTRATIHKAYRADYHDGRIYTTLVKTVFYLTAIESDADGPFCYVQGSHKANFRFPWEEVGLDGQTCLSESAFPGLRKVMPGPGDMILLNEGLLHGAMRTQRERQVLSFTYGPAFLSDFRTLHPQKKHLQELGYYDNDYESAGDGFNCQPGPDSLRSPERPRNLGRARRKAER